MNTGHNTIRHNGEKQHGTDYFLDFYAFLDVPYTTSPKNAKAMAKASYKKLAQLYHPDHNQELPSNMLAECSRRFRLTSLAYDGLSDNRLATFHRTELITTNLPISTDGIYVMVHGQRLPLGIMLPQDMQENNMYDNPAYRPAISVQPMAVLALAKATKRYQQNAGVTPTPKHTQTSYS